MIRLRAARTLLVGFAVAACTWSAHASRQRPSTFQQQSARPQSLPFDVLVTGGRLVDGTGAPARRADIGIRHRRIAAIGRLSNQSAHETIDASGFVVAPGFIDVHTHADDVAEHARAENFVRMGLTSIVAGNCGESALDIGDALSTLRDGGMSVNFATLIGHNTVRRAAMGTDDREPTAAEMTKMKSLVWRGMVDGAVGFSTGLQYVPGTYAAPPEIIELARVAAVSGGLYASHMRNEGTALAQSVRETIQVGEAARCPVQISHLKVDSPNRWGASAEALSLIDAARARGLQVAADQYAYTAASSTLGIRFPSWALEGGSARISERLNDAATWGRIRREMQQLLAERGFTDLTFAVVAAYRPDPSLNGLTMKQVASKLKGSESVDAQLEAAREMMLGGGASMVYHLMSDDDVTTIMRHPHVAFASDSSVLAFGSGMPHPRGYGNNARVLSEYVRQRGVITLEEAIRKMTSLPARHFRLANRGAIAEGYAADIVIFDPSRVADTATFATPHSYPVGIHTVLVNGVAVLRSGEHTGARPGEVLTVGDR